MQRGKGLVRRTPLRSYTRLKSKTPLKSKGFSLKKSRFKIKNKINPKDFTPEVVASMNLEQGGKCLRCHSYSHLDPHHKKPRSAITAKDIKELGPGGGMANCIGLCRSCHEAVHRHDPGTEIYRTSMHQNIGENSSPLNA